MPTLTDAELAGYAKGAGFSGADIGIAVAVALAESGGRTDAVNRANRNGSTDYGVWQINTVHKDLLSAGTWADPASNARMAYSIFSGSRNTWRPWSTYNNGSYLKYLPRGNTASGSPTISTGTPAGGVTVGNVVTAALDPFATLSYFTNPALWARVGIILMGGALLVFSIWKLTGAGDAIVRTARTVVRARTGGLVG